MKPRFKLAVVGVAAAVAVILTATIAAATAHDRSRFDTALTGYQETPTLSTSASGSFQASIKRSGDTIMYTLSYKGPFDANPAGGTVTQAHIHLGAPAIAGGVMAFLCSNLGNAPTGTPACPAEGTVTGTITAAQVIGPANQGVAPGEFNELLRALRAGAAYVNVHTTTFQAGEIRGQVPGDQDRRD